MLEMEQRGNSIPVSLLLLVGSLCYPKGGSLGLDDADEKVSLNY